MSDSEFHSWIEPELEARVVAWVLGEASAFEAAELERLAAEKPELAIFKRRIEAVHGLVARAARPEPKPLRLSPERRKQLLEKIGGAAAPVPQLVAAPARRVQIPWNFLVTLAACIAIAVVIAGISLPAFTVRGKRATNRLLSDARAGEQQQQQEVKKQSAALEAPASAPEEAEPSIGSNITEARDGFGLAGNGTGGAKGGSGIPDGAAARGAKDATAGESSGGITRGNFADEADSSKFAELSTPQVEAITREREQLTLEKSLRLRGQASARGSEDEAPSATSSLDGTVNTESARTPSPAATPAGQMTLARGNTYSGATTVSGGQLKTPQLGDVPILGRAFQNRAGIDSESIAQPERVLADRLSTDADSSNKPASDQPTDQSQTLSTTISANGNLAFGLAAASAPATEKLKEFSGQINYGSPLNPSAPPVPVTGPVFSTRSTADKKLEQEKGKDLLATNEVTVQSGAVRSVVKVKEVSRIHAEQKQEAKPSAESAQQVVRDEIAVATQPFSTFSLHVSDVSFRLASAALSQNQMPDRESIRPEEFYNAFDYGDPAPVKGEPVGCHIEQSAHPFLQQRNLVRIAMKVPSVGRNAQQPLRLTVLLDTSGSMEREDRAASVQRAMAVLASLLGPNDRITLIGFSRQARIIADQVPGDRASQLVDQVAHTPAEGGTNLEAALQLAGEQALKQRARAAQNRIVLITDGAANLGNARPPQLGAMVEKLRQQGIAFDACGVGADGLNDEILEALTRKGDGRYYLLNRPEDADTGFAQQLAGAFRPAAKNVKVQVRFNPSRVGHYRLVGFEQHRLNKEDFRNDKVDAAELAADEAAVAIYQVEVLPEGDGELGDVYVRFRNTASGEMVERSWTLPFEEKARAFDQASPSMQLAGTASLLAEKLQGSAMANGIDLDALAPVVAGLRGHYPAQARVGELVTMYERLRRILNH